MPSTASDSDLAYRHFLYTGGILAAIPGGVLIVGEGWWYAGFVLVPLAAGTSFYAAWLSRHLLSDRRLKVLSVLTYAFLATVSLVLVVGVLGIASIWYWVMWIVSIALGVASLGYGVGWLFRRRASR